MADYTYKELMKMQNDAIRRVEDMKNRAQRQAGLTGDKQVQQEVPVDKPKRIAMPNDYLKRDTTQTKEEEVFSPLPLKSNNSFFDTISNNFNDINIDPDRALLLSLILLLTEEKADQALIMALIYML